MSQELPVHAGRQLGESANQTRKLRQPRRFAVAMASVLLLAVLAGFAPTFLLRPVFTNASMPPHLYIHGAVLTGWFFWLLLQTSLIANHRPALHRRLGIVGVLLAAAVVATGLQTANGFVPHMQADGIDAALRPFGADSAHPESNPLIVLIVSGNYSALLVFAVLVCLAVAFRRRAEVHGRLMLLASIGLIGPAALRISLWFGGSLIPVRIRVGLLIFALLAAMIVHDVRSRGRVHVATLAGSVFMLVTTVAFVRAGIGQAAIAYFQTR